MSRERNTVPAFDPACYLCPGVTRASGKTNPVYSDVFAFDNDFASLSIDDTLYNSIRYIPGDEPAKGVCRVVCFSPRHNLTLAEMTATDIYRVLEAFRNEYVSLGAIPGIKNVMCFENKGAIIGVSNPHPHGQVYATDFIPEIPRRRYENARRHREEHSDCLFCRILADELADGSRMVLGNDHFAAFVPSFARHSFEVFIMPRRHVPSIAELTPEEMTSLADIYHAMLVKYDNLFEMSFPNKTIFQNVPTDDSLDPSPYHFHIEFCPPLRSRDKLKYLAGFETGGGNIVNPTLPCESAATLRSLSTVHYLSEKT